MPLRNDEIKEVQAIALTSAKTAAVLAYSQLMDKIAALEKRLNTLEKTKPVDTAKTTKTVK